MITLVIARYNENVSWINSVPPYAKVFLYNKGADISKDAFHRDVTIIQLPNTGRESGTYLHHLMYNFDHTDNGFTVFTQGDPFEHSPKFIKLLNIPHHWQDIQPLSLLWLENKQIPPIKILQDEQKDWLGGIPIRREYFGLKTWSPVDFYDSGAWNIGFAYLKNHSLPLGTNIAAHFFQLCGLSALSDLSANADIGVFSYGAIFAIKNERISAFLYEASKNLAKMELLSRTGTNYGYIFERCWLHFFGEPFVSFK